MMSILKYFCPVKEKLELSNPNGSLSGSMLSSAILSANVKVTDVLENTYPHTTVSTENVNAIGLPLTCIL